MTATTALSRDVPRESPLLDDSRRDRARPEIRPELQPETPSGVQHAVHRLERWMRDPDVTEVIVNAGGEVWIEHRHTGHPEYAGRLPPGALDVVVERALAPVGRRLDRSTPVVDARLADGSRLCAVLAPVAVDGTCLAVRRFAPTHVAVTDFAPSPLVELLREIIERRCNVVVSGSTSSGKTTLLGALAELASPVERLVTLEDTAELRIRSPHVLRLECRPGTPDGLVPVDLGTLVRTALRLRPDRLVVGEVRGDEAVELLQALNTGHDGSLCSIHANTPHDAIARLEALVLRASPAWSLAAVRHLVQRAVDVVVHLERLADGTRQVVAIGEVQHPRAEITLRALADRGTTHGALGRGRR